MDDYPTVDRLREELEHRLRHRKRLCRVLTFGRHWFEKEWQEVHAGPVGFEESSVTLIGAIRQCRICYHAEHKTAVEMLGGGGGGGGVGDLLP